MPSSVRWARDSAGGVVAAEDVAGEDDTAELDGRGVDGAVVAVVDGGGASTDDVLPDPGVEEVHPASVSRAAAASQGRRISRPSRTCG
jgi:hypothetical protein